jgi:hypothetical protein
MKSIVSIAFLSIVAILLSCARSCGCDPGPLSVFSDMYGKWEWIKTTTPTKTIWAKDAGYRRKMTFLDDPDVHATRITFFKNDSLETTFLISKVLEDNWETKSVLLKYNYAAQLKLFQLPEMTNQHYDIEVSEIMPVYSIEADTIRHYYQHLSYQ